MSKRDRAAKKDRAFAKRDLRSFLVHSAGCVDPRCITHVDLDSVEEWAAAGVRIPRSIKKRKGMK